MHKFIIFLIGNLIILVVIYLQLTSVGERPLFQWPSNARVWCIYQADTNKMDLLRDPEGVNNATLIWLMTQTLSSWIFTLSITLSCVILRQNCPIRTSSPTMIISSGINKRTSALVGPGKKWKI